MKAKTALLRVHAASLNENHNFTKKPNKMCLPIETPLQPKSAMRQT